MTTEWVKAFSVQVYIRLEIQVVSLMIENGKKTKNKKNKNKKNKKKKNKKYKQQN